MAVPKKRHSQMRRDRRRSHLALKPAQPVLCSHCKQPMVAHRVCANCGYYAGVEVKPPEEVRRNRRETGPCASTPCCAWPGPWTVRWRSG